MKKVFSTELDDGGGLIEEGLKVGDEAFFVAWYYDMDARPHSAGVITSIETRERMPSLVKTDKYPEGFNKDPEGKKCLFTRDTAYSVGGRYTKAEYAAPSRIPDPVEVVFQN